MILAPRDGPVTKLAAPTAEWQLATTCGLLRDGLTLSEQRDRVGSSGVFSYYMAFKREDGLTPSPGGVNRGDGPRGSGEDRRGGSMSRRGRWDYMGEARHNPPSDDCPECEAPSKTFHQGAKTVDGVKFTRFICEHRHEWTVRDPP